MTADAADWLLRVTVSIIHKVNPIVNIMNCNL